MIAPKPTCDCSICTDYAAGRTAIEVAALHPPLTQWGVYHRLKKHRTVRRSVGARRFRPLTGPKKIALLRKALTYLLLALPAESARLEHHEARQIADDALRQTAPEDRRKS